MADSKIKRITNADLIAKVDNLGGKISAVIEKELATQLQKTSDPAEWSKLCQLVNLPRTKAIAKGYEVDIRLLGAADIRNKALDPKSGKFWMRTATAWGKSRSQFQYPENQ